MMSKKRTYTYLFILFLALAFVSMLCPSRSDDSDGLNDFTQYSRQQLDSLSLASLRKVDNYPFYMMTFYGDYGFSNYLQTGDRESFAALTSVMVEEEPWSCTCFAALGNPSALLGRNFDWHDCIPLLLFTDPPGGYASVSMIDLEYLGFHRGNLPDASGDSRNLLQAPWLPFDGMNEMGVAIGMMAIPHAEPPYDPEKITIDEIELIRLVLDYAESVEHAISLIQRYNIRMLDPPIHYLIADVSGRSAIVEFVGGEMIVHRNEHPWQVSTNFIIHGSGALENATCWRYNTVYEQLEDSEGRLDKEAAVDLLRSVSQFNTRWSMVYDMRTCEVHATVGGDYNDIKKFSLE